MSLTIAFKPGCPWNLFRTSANQYWGRSSMKKLHSPTRKTKKLVSLAAAVLLLQGLAVQGCRADTFSTTCGSAQFEIIRSNRGHPLDTRYELYGTSFNRALPKRSLYIAEQGGWFYASCVPGKQGLPLLLFQSFCGGSGCVEDKYGLVEPTSLRLLIAPPTKNSGNSKQTSLLLGRQVPYLPNESDAFCCDQK